VHAGEGTSGAKWTAIGDDGPVPPDRIPARLLSHVELVYAPGERALVARAFELLGCSVRDPGGRFLVVRATAEGSSTENVWYASEVTREQWSLERSLRSLAGDDGLAGALDAYARLATSRPQDTPHFGIQYASLDELDAAVARVQRVDEVAPELAGRIGIARRIDPGDPASLSAAVVQVFLRTSLFACGLLTLGQVVELQHYPA
jgi:hypothetical protein